MHKLIFKLIFLIGVTSVNVVVGIEPLQATSSDSLTLEPVLQLEQDLSDGDGVEDENTINNGDGNGDGILDSEQASVTSIISPVTDKSITLEIIGGDCQAIREFKIIDTADLEDNDYKYSHGLLDYRLLCSKSGQSATINIYFDKEYNEPWIWRKFNRNTSTYSTIPEDAVTYSIAKVGNTTVTKVIFKITDGDANDEDGKSNGVIIDPVGPATKTEHFDLRLLLLAIGLIIFAFIFILWKKYKKQTKPPLDKVILWSNLQKKSVI